jgi:CRP-like cAMP-binding protein
MTRSVAPWIQRLSRHAPLTPEEQRVLHESVAATRHFATHDDLVKAGEPADRLFVILDGYACRYRLLADGRRQIVSYLFAGDMSDPRELLNEQMLFSLCVLWPSVVATLSADVLHRLESHSNLRLALARYAYTQQVIAQEWLINVGQRTAFERVGHLLCEIFSRLDAIGLASGHHFELPLTQAELGDTLALSAVHVNRTLMELRRLDLVTFQNRQVRIHDFARLSAASGFDPGYLHRGEITARIGNERIA